MTSAPGGDVVLTRFTVLFVCTGNICRSPMAERIFRARLKPEMRTIVQTISAGLHALAGHPMDPLAARVLTELGGNPERHAGQQLTGSIVGAADLVLTATADQRSRIIRDQPLAMRRAFTLREFVRLGASLTPPTRRPDRSWLTARVADVAAQRGYVATVDRADDEIGDPYGGAYEVMRACGVTIADAVDGLGRVLGVGLSPQR